MNIDSVTTFNINIEIKKKQFLLKKQINKANNLFLFPKIIKYT